jgi:TatD DNase family protein
MWIDSHCHLQLFPRSNSSLTAFDLLDTLEIDHLMCVATSVSEYNDLLRVKDYGRGKVFISLGEHPCNETFDFEQFERIVKIEGKGMIEAIGELGFDASGCLKRQREWFDLQAQVASDVNLPIILHTRNAEEETMAALKSWPNLKGVFHCFTGSQKLADFAVEMGWYVSFSGIVTFKKCDELRAIAQTIPLNQLLIETDAPFLAPEPKRGHVNIPDYVKYLGDYMSNLLSIPEQAFAFQMKKNYHDLFNKNGAFK